MDYHDLFFWLKLTERLYDERGPMMVWYLFTKLTPNSHLFFRRITREMMPNQLMVLWQILSMEMQSRWLWFLTFYCLLFLVYDCLIHNSLEKKCWYLFVKPRLQILGFPESYCWYVLTLSSVFMINCSVKYIDIESSYRQSLMQGDWLLLLLHCW